MQLKTRSSIQTYIKTHIIAGGWPSESFHYHCWLIFFSWIWSLAGAHRRPNKKQSQILKRRNFQMIKFHPLLWKKYFDRIWFFFYGEKFRKSKQMTVFFFFCLRLRKCFPGEKMNPLKPSRLAHLMSATSAHVDRAHRERDSEIGTFHPLGFYTRPHRLEWPLLSTLASLPSCRQTQSWKTTA